MKLRQYYLSAGVAALAVSMSFSVSFSVSAQVDISDARTTGVSTSTIGTGGTPSNIKISSGGSIKITTGAGVTVDSDNTLNTKSGSNITSNNSDNVTGILVSGNVKSTITSSGNITLTEKAAKIPANGNVAKGTGRIGILISGSSTLTGNIIAGGKIVIRGQNSAGIRLDADASIIGNIKSSSAISLLGENTVGIDVRGNAGTTSVDGDVKVTGNIKALGQGAQAINVAGDVTGGLTVTSGLFVNGYVNAKGKSVSTRSKLSSRNKFVSEGRARQAGSAVNVSANIRQGIHFGKVTNSKGKTTSSATVSLVGSAPAIIIDGKGTPISIGIVAKIIDPNDKKYDADLQYAFVNQGRLTANGLLNDVDATTLSIADARLVNGINNTNKMTATVYRSGIAADATAATNDATARVIVIGSGGIVDAINNSGSIRAFGFEDTAQVFADKDNPLAPNLIQVTAIDVQAGGALNGALTNTGTIQAALTGRRGTAIAIRDASGTLRVINNSGTIKAFAKDSDSRDTNTTDFTVIAIDVRNNTTGVTISQTTVTTKGKENSPSIDGDILLGSGDDTLTVAGGKVTGLIDFGAGSNTLDISNKSVVTTTLKNSGKLALTVADNSTLAITSTTDINTTSASFDSTSTFRPFIDATTIDANGFGQASTLVSSGAITFSDGAIIAPVLNNVMDVNSARFVIAQADGGLRIADLTDQAVQDALRGSKTPFMYNATLSRSTTNPNKLILTLSLRDTTALGLDRQQAEMFSNGAYEAMQLSDKLGAAFAKITDGNIFNAAINQLMPGYAASIREFMLANIDGTTGAVGTHLNNARRSQDKPSGIWIEEFAYFADKGLTGLSDQFRGYGFGITGGFDTTFGPFHTVGLNLGFSTTEIEDVVGIDEPLDIFSLQGGFYAGYELGGLGINLYAGGGYNDFESNRRVKIGAFDQSANGKWKGSHYNLSANAGYDIKMGKKYFLRPEVGITYLGLNEKAYKETGSTDIALAIDSRTSKIGTASAILNFGARFEKKRIWWAPSIRVGYRNDFERSGTLTSGRFINGTSLFSLRGNEYTANGVLFGISLAAGSKYSSFSLDYDGDVRSGFNRHTVRLVLRLLF
ncbi:MAG: autotransporter domain-containing protein [Robiginitomaculum sp.]